VVGGLEGLDEVLDTADGLLLAVLEVPGHQHTDGEGLVPEESVLELHEVGHGGVKIDELRPVEVHLHVQDSVHRHKYVAYIDEKEGCPGYS